MEISMEPAQKNENTTTVNPIRSLLSIYIQRNVSLHITRDTCTPMFVAALFAIAKLCNQPRCPSAVNG
jgi:hypothetical protein